MVIKQLTCLNIISSRLASVIFFFLLPLLFNYSLTVHCSCLSLILLSHVNGLEGCCVLPYYDTFANIIFVSVVPIVTVVVVVVVVIAIATIIDLTFIAINPA